jgi:biotin carboxyl carrier protein
MTQIEVKSEVAGSVWKVLVQTGDPVAEDAQLMIVESMKMEIPVLSISAGRVVELRVTEGEAVAEGQVVAVIES